MEITHKLMPESSLQEHGVETLFRPDNCTLAAARGQPLQRKLFPDIISVCLRQGYSQFIRLIPYAVFYSGRFIVQSNIS